MLGEIERKGSKNLFNRKMRKIESQSSAGYVHKTQRGAERTERNNDDNVKRAFKSNKNNETFTGRAKQNTF